MAIEPITRQEAFMNAVATGTSVDLEPITREEMFLAKAGGQNVTTPTPITRREMFLSKISGSSGGGGEVGDDYVVEINPPSTIKTYTDGVSAKIADNQFKGFKELTTVSAPLVTSIGDHAFDGCSKLLSLYIGEFTAFSESKVLTYIGAYAFNSCIALRTIEVKLYDDISFDADLLGIYAFANCINLEKVDLLFSFTDVPTGAFSGCTNLKTLVLRYDGSDEGLLMADTALAGTPIENGSGYIYVPSKCIDGYKENNPAIANQFRILEDYTVDGTINGELDETKI